MKAEVRRLYARAKTRTVAFKADAKLAEFLRWIPNTSDFIRKAILTQFGMSCPLCTGTGVVARGVGEHYAGVISEHRYCACVACGTTEPIPVDPVAVSATDRNRWHQFFHGGPLYCPACYAGAAACVDCGWRMRVDLLAEHQTDHHR